MLVEDISAATSIDQDSSDLMLLYEVGSQLGACGSFDEKLMLRVSIGISSAPLAGSRCLVLFPGLVIAKISSFLIGCLFISLWVLSSFRSASKFDRKVFAISFKSLLSRLSSTSFLRIAHSPVSWVLLL